MMGIIGILIALGLLIYLSYRGMSVLLLAPAMAVVAVVLSGAPLLASYTQVFMPAMGGFVVQYFPLFLLGALFGKLMNDTGSARALAETIAERLGVTNTIPAIVLACAMLTYGGVSLFVVAFAVYPIAAAMFERAKLPSPLIPATIALGAFTFTMTALPGTPAIQNAIPMPYFGTTAFAAPGIGIIAGAIMLGGGLAWLLRRAASWSGAQGGSGGVPRSPKEIRELAQGEGFDLTSLSNNEQENLPTFGLAILPIVLVIGLNYLFSAYLLPALDTGYLADAKFGAITFGSVLGVWSIILALLLSIAAMAVLNRERLKSVKETFDDGANAATSPAFNTASLVGFGAVIASLPAFDLIRDAVLGLSPANPLISLAVAVNILAGITGSASGGMSIALETLGPTYLEMGREAGIAPDLLHRITAIATGGLDALPHNGAVITLLAVCKLTHREAYWDIFIVACAIPIVALITVVTLGSLVGSF
ncbi:MAG: transporter [Hyphomicrobium sp. 32-62-53]|nr:MAG: transporter [Hyphomicrobium sp. 12-62-95]OYX98007.1 MAG: transporter [Hyphomicrobium sp. 32-62-53]